MRRIMLMFSLTAMLVVSALPMAFAQERNDRQDDRQEQREERFEDEGFFFGEDGFFFDGDRFDGDRFDGDRFDEDFEDGFFFDGDRFDNDFDGVDFDSDGSGVSQDFEQETESGDVEQSFNVSNTGDNSNQCANVNGTVNTGNLQTQTGSIQYASDIDEFEQEDIGSELSVSGDSTVTCDQQVNQAAATG